MADHDTQELHSAIDRHLRDVAMDELLTPKQDAPSAPRIYSRQEILAFVASNRWWLAAGLAVIATASLYLFGILDA